MERFAGKVAIVTGAGQGIGRGIARRLVREGAQVLIAEYNLEAAGATAAELSAEAIEQGGAAFPYRVDISDTSATQRMVDDIVTQFGHIDILVNNAGVVQTKPMLELTEADWDRVLDVNLRGTFFLVQAVAQQMIRQLPQSLREAAARPADIVRVAQAAASVEAEEAAKSFAASYGKIVNLSSVAGRRGRPLQTHYAASKAAIISLTQSAALTLAPYRINVNAVCPGIVPTPMWEKIDEDRGK